MLFLRRCRSLPSMIQCSASMGPNDHAAGCGNSSGDLAVREQQVAVVSGGKLALPNIKTSSWFTPLPEEHLRIGISRGVPRQLPAGYRRYRKLFPGNWFNSVTPIDYERLYAEQVLSKLDPRRVVEDLIEIAGGQVPVLVCYEKPDTPAELDWCHRSLVSVWFRETIGLDVPELGRETCGCGHSHPKLHPSLRRHIEPVVRDRSAGTFIQEA